MAKYQIELVKWHVVQVEAETQEEAEKAVALMTDAEVESAVVDYWQKRHVMGSDDWLAELEVSIIII